MRVIDTEGAAVSRQALVVIDPDGGRHDLVTDDDGNVRLDAIGAGMCDVALRALDGRDWSIDGGGEDGDLRPDEPSHHHVATAGDCLSSLARRKGFRSLQPLVRANGELLATRPAPETSSVRGTHSVGSLGPWDVEQGWRARLHNLGYLASPGAEAGALRRGVALFQRDHGLAADGDVGPRTLAALREVHGC